MIMLVDSDTNNIYSTWSSPKRGTFEKVHKTQGAPTCATIFGVANGAAGIENIAVVRPLGSMGSSREGDRDTCGDFEDYIILIERPGGPGGRRPPGPLPTKRVSTCVEFAIVVALGSPHRNCARTQATRRRRTATRIGPRQCGSYIRDGEDASKASTHAFCKLFQNFCVFCSAGGSAAQL